MKYIRIKSQGIIDPKAFTLIGASSKRGDNSKIGFFGSGLKYSIAYLLRNNIEFKVFSEYQEFTFAKEKTQFRDKEFDIILVNGEKTSMTTEMGMDWEAWFIIREIYCNALDEGESEVRVINTDKTEVKPMEGQTVFYIAAEQFKDVVENWGDYFTEGRDDFVAEHNGTKFFRTKEESVTYRKGIRCGVFKAPTVFNYDCDWIKVNESRVIADDFHYKYELVKRICQCDNPIIINQFYARINDCMEKDFYWDSHAGDFNDMWLECLQNKALVPTENAGFWMDMLNENPGHYLMLPDKICKALKNRFVDKVRVVGEENGLGTEANFRPTERTDKMNNMIIKAMEFLKKANYEISYTVEVVKFVNDLQLGQALKEKIYLADKLFDKGMKQVITCLMEENEHIKSGHGDESRSFQTHIFESWVSSMETYTKEYL